MDSKFNDKSDSDSSDGSKTPAVGFPCVNYDDADDGDDAIRRKNNTHNSGIKKITINDDNIKNYNWNSNSDTNSTHTSTEDDHRLYPADCYSFLSLYGPRLNLGNFTLSCSFSVHIHYNYQSLVFLTSIILTAIHFCFLCYSSSNQLEGFFSFGVMVYLFQISFLIFMVLSKVHKGLSANGEIDNPSVDLIANFVHSNASRLVRATQFTALLSYVVFADASVQDVVKAGTL
jgi:hypothetical protein